MLIIKVSMDRGLLHYDISGHNFEITEFIIDANIAVNIINSDGETDLHSLCIDVNQNMAIDKRMLEKGIDINVRNKYGNNAMWKAAHNSNERNYDMVRLLMKYNSDITTKNKAGRSTIDLAEQTGDKLLLEILTH